MRMGPIRKEIGILRTHARTSTVEVSEWIEAQGRRPSRGTYVQDDDNNQLSDCRIRGFILSLRVWKKTTFDWTRAQKIIRLNLMSQQEKRKTNHAYVFIRGCLSHDSTRL